MKSPFHDLKEVAYRCNMQLAEHNLVIFSFGNVSAMDRDRNVFAIKPSGVAYQDLCVKDMVIVDMDNKIVEGRLRPSSDTKTHNMLYRHFSEITGVCHTHSPYAVAWAQAMKPIPIFGTTHADHLTADVPCTEIMSDAAIQGDYEEETGKQILQAFKNLSHQEIEMVLVACHGPFTWGKTPDKAVYNSVILEELARMALWTVQANPHTPRLKKTLIDKHYYRKHGEDAYYGQKS